MYTPQRARPKNGRNKNKIAVEFAEFNGNLSGQEIAPWAGGYIKGGSSGFVLVIPRENAPEAIVTAWQYVVKDVDGDITIYDRQRFNELFDIITNDEEADK